MSVMAGFPAAILDHKATLREKSMNTKEAQIPDDHGVTIFSMDCLLVAFFYLKRK